MLHAFERSIFNSDNVCIISQVIELSSGLVLVSKTAQEVIEILPLSRDYVGFKFVGSGGGKVWSAATGFVDPDLKLEDWIRSSGTMKIHIVAAQ